MGVPSPGLPASLQVSEDPRQVADVEFRGCGRAGKKLVPESEDRKKIFGEVGLSQIDGVGSGQMADELVQEIVTASIGQLLKERCGLRDMGEGGPDFCAQDVESHAFLDPSIIRNLGEL